MQTGALTHLYALRWLYIIGVNLGRPTAARATQRPPHVVFAPRPSPFSMFSARAQLKRTQWGRPGTEAMFMQFPELFTCVTVKLSCYKVPSLLLASMVNEGGHTHTHACTCDVHTHTHTNVPHITESPPYYKVYLLLQIQSPITESPPITRCTLASSPGLQRKGHMRKKMEEVCLHIS